MVRPPLNLAIAGTRGVPACYSGFETFAEELGARLSDRGHQVTVYGRVPYVGAERRSHRGMRVVPVRSPRGKHLETPLHTLATAVVAWRARHDVVLVCNGANAFALPLFRLAGSRVAINVDGIDRLRRKWGALGRLWFRVGEPLSLLLSDRAVTDAIFLRDYYADRYRWPTEVIHYGGDRAPSPGAPPAAEVLARLGLRPGEYVLQVARLVPENNALMLVRAYSRLESPPPLVIVGDAPYCAGYRAELEAAARATPGVVLAGGIYGDDYLALQAHAACYVAAGEVGGTHPALVEAMTHGGPVVANDVPEHREVLGEAARYYTPGDPASLAAALAEVLEDPAGAADLRARSRARARERYRWDEVVSRYEQMFYAMREERP
jgi:glycosyltransferase involved in cell wall biosynthesis